MYITGCISKFVTTQVVQNLLKVIGYCRRLRKLNFYNHPQGEIHTDSFLQAERFLRKLFPLMLDKNLICAICGNIYKISIGFQTTWIVTNILIWVHSCPRAVTSVCGRR